MSCRFVLWLAASILARSALGALPTAHPPIALHDVNAHVVHPFEGTPRKATCIIFIARDCPVSNTYAPEIGRIAKEYGAKQVRFYVVYVEPDIKAAAARKHAKD